MPHNDKITAAVLDAEAGLEERGHFDGDARDALSAWARSILGPVR